jgi:hypothetical protein
MAYELKQFNREARGRATGAQAPSTAGNFSKPLISPSNIFLL